MVYTFIIIDLESQIAIERGTFTFIWRKANEMEDQQRLTCSVPEAAKIIGIGYLRSVVVHIQVRAFLELEPQ